MRPTRLVETEAELELRLTIPGCREGSMLGIRLSYLTTGRSVQRFVTVGSEREIALILAEILDDEWQHLAEPQGPQGPQASPEHGSSELAVEVEELRTQVAELDERLAQSTQSMASDSDSIHDRLGPVLGLSADLQLFQDISLFGATLSLAVPLSNFTLHVRTSAMLGRVFVAPIGSLELFVGSVSLGLGSRHDLGELSLIVSALTSLAWLRVTSQASSGMVALEPSNHALVWAGAEVQLVAPLGADFEWFTSLEVGYVLLGATFTGFGSPIASLSGAFAHTTVGVMTNL